jgi:hypothetical protein
LSDNIIYERDLENGTTLYLTEMLFNVRLVQGPTGWLTFDRGWCYDRRLLAPAMHDAMNWDGEGDPPGPWMKAVHSGVWRGQFQCEPEQALVLIEARDA